MRCFLLAALSGSVCVGGEQRPRRITLCLCYFDVLPRGTRTLDIRDPWAPARPPRRTPDPTRARPAPRVGPRARHNYCSTSIGIHQTTQVPRSKALSTWGSAVTFNVFSPPSLMFVNVCSARASATAFWAGGSRIFSREKAAGPGAPGPAVAWTARTYSGRGTSTLSFVGSSRLTYRRHSPAQATGGSAFCALRRL